MNFAVVPFGTILLLPSKGRRENKFSRGRVISMQNTATKTLLRNIEIRRASPAAFSRSRARRREGDYLRRRVVHPPRRRLLSRVDCCL